MPEPRTNLDALAQAWLKRADSQPLAVLSSPVARLSATGDASLYVCRLGRRPSEPLTQLGVILLVDLDSHDVFAAPIGSLESQPVELDEGAEIVRIDIRRLIPENHQPKHVVVRALMRGLASHARPIEISSADYHKSWTGTDGKWAKSTMADMQKTLTDAIPLGELAMRIAASPPEADPFPSYRRDAKSPPTPESLGATIAVDRVVERAPDARWVLRGAFRIAPRLEDRTADGETKKDGTPTAVVRASIVLIGSDEPGPWIIPARLPTWDPIHPLKLTAVATGTFAFDLFSTFDIPQREQSYWAHLFAGTLHVGPFPSAVVMGETVRADVAAGMTPV